jgi:hypothetical protein
MLKWLLSSYFLVVFIKSCIVAGAGMLVVWWKTRGTRPDQISANDPEPTIDAQADRNIEASAPVRGWDDVD